MVAICMQSIPLVVLLLHTWDTHHASLLGHEFLHPPLAYLLHLWVHGETEISLSRTLQYYDRTTHL